MAISLPVLRSVLLLRVALLVAIACTCRCSEPPYDGYCPVTCPTLHSSCDPATSTDLKCSCDPGYTSCGADCVSLPSDESHCGACGAACDVDHGYTCVNSNCVCKTSVFHLCRADGGPDVCSDPATDRHNCGSCGNDCGLLECSNNSCSCPPALHECLTPTPDGGSDRTCADLSGDLDNCGGCGVLCGSPSEARDVRARVWQCVGAAGGPSTCSCRAGYAHCEGTPSSPESCVDLTSDADNCGSCRNVCFGGVCDNSHCGCDAPGYVLCLTAPPSDKFACHLPESTPTHCGNASGDNCGTDCTKLAVSDPLCDNGVCACTINLDAGTICGLDAGASPFCTDLSSDPTNCGRCFAAIAPPFSTCASGRPSCDINKGEQLCLVPDASFCANTNRGDPAHCGACSGPSSVCATWNGDNSICLSSSCQCAEDIDSTPHAPDAGPAAHCIISASQVRCSCNDSQLCNSETARLSWGADIFPLLQTGPGGMTSASRLGCTASGCHAGGVQQAAGHLDLSDLDAGYAGLVTGPIFGGKTCATPPGPATVGAFNCPCVAQVTPGATDPVRSVLISLVANGNYPLSCQNQFVHSDAQQNRLSFSPCAQLILEDWIDAGAEP